MKLRLLMALDPPPVANVPDRHDCDTDVIDIFSKFANVLAARKVQE